MKGTKKAALFIFLKYAEMQERYEKYPWWKKLLVDAGSVISSGIMTFIKVVCFM